MADMYERKVLVRTACALPGTSLQLRPCRLLAYEKSRGLWPYMLRQWASSAECQPVY